MNTIQSSEKKPIQLQWDGGNVVITPENQDRFVKEAPWAIAACQGMLAFEKYFDQFKSQFLPALHKWCLANNDRINACYVPAPGSQVTVYVIGSTQSFDFDLSKMLTDLEVDLGNAGWPTDIIQLPYSTPEMLLSFFNPAESIQVYGNAIRTPSEGGA